MRFRSGKPRRPSRFKKRAMYDGGDDDCELCRMLAGRAPTEVVTLPDGTLLEVHEMPPRGVTS